MIIISGMDCVEVESKFLAGVARGADRMSAVILSTGV